ncbi:unnamed protein product, partial [Thelazia callipaeda]|uniref:CACTA en-spm transposon protein n=1 Tax=Thelazia callipaeda TaxID=103827 RepID=A0A0N5CTM2_THECL
MTWAAKFLQISDQISDGRLLMLQKVHAIVKIIGKEGSWKSQKAREKCVQRQKSVERQQFLQASQVRRSDERRSRGISLRDEYSSCIADTVGATSNDLLASSDAPSQLNRVDTSVNRDNSPRLDLKTMWHPMLKSTGKLQEIENPRTYLNEVLAKHQRRTAKYHAKRNSILSKSSALHSESVQQHSTATVSDASELPSVSHANSASAQQHSNSNIEVSEPATLYSESIQYRAEPVIQHSERVTHNSVTMPHFPQSVASHSKSVSYNPESNLHDLDSMPHYS